MSQNDLLKEFQKHRQVAAPSPEFREKLKQDLMERLPEPEPKLWLSPKVGVAFAAGLAMVVLAALGLYQMRYLLGIKEPMELASISIQAKILYTVGEVAVTPVGKAPMPAHVGMVVDPGSMIQTRSGSKAELLFNTGGLSVVGENTRTKLSITLNADSGNTTRLFAGVGRIFVDVKKLAQYPNRFVASSPTAVAAIRGTSFEMEVLDRSTIVRVVEGRVKVVEKENKQSVVVVAGSKTRVEKAKPPVVPEQVSDEDVDALSKWVGKERVQEIRDAKNLERYKRRQARFRRIGKEAVQVKAKAGTTSPLPSRQKGGKQKAKVNAGAKAGRTSFLQRGDKSKTKRLVKDKLVVQTESQSRTQEIEKTGKQVLVLLLDPNADLVALLARPDVVQALKENSGWVLEHKDVLAKIIANRDFLAQHGDVVKKWFLIIQSEPGLAKVLLANREFLGQHPEFAKELFANPNLWKRYSDLLGLLLENQAYLGQHPWVAKTVYQNREWLVQHPQVAKLVYENRTMLAKNPELTKWLYRQTKWLELHPKIAKHVYQNLEYLNKHPDVQMALYKNRGWLIKHPEVAIEVYRNQEFFARHPKAARQLCEVREFFEKHPQIAKALYEHRDFLRKNPDIARRIRRIIQQSIAK